MTVGRAGPPRAAVVVVLLLVAAVLVPYWRLTTMVGVIATDDRFTSDVLSGEWPARVEIGRALRAGELPTWTAAYFTGAPLAGLSFDPLTLLCFGLLAPVAALNVFLLVTLLVAALGAYAYVRALSGTHSGAALSGVAFAYSGYMVCQLKHLGIVATVCWLPVALLLLERALRPDDAPLRERLRALLAFAGVFGLQLLAGFPQSAYLCGLAYAACVVARALPLARRERLGPRCAALLLAGFGAACALAVALSAAQWMPLRDVSTQTARGSGVSLEFIHRSPYWPRDLWTFLVPYLNGDVSDGTYRGTGVFWEGYGYVGIITVVLAVFAVARGHRRAPVRYLVGLAVVSLLLVLGPHTPVFALAFRFVPGMSLFRFPTRFLVLVDFALAALGGLGATELERLLSARRTRLLRGQLSRGLAPWVPSAALAALTFADLVFHQMRQNPIVDARRWLSAPPTVRAMRDADRPFRVFSVGHAEEHSDAFARARGWADLEPYYAHRDMVEPDANALWNIDVADGYAGLVPTWSTAIWGNTGTNTGLVRMLWSVEGRPPTVRLRRPFATVMALHNVRYVIAPFPLDLPGAVRIPVASRALLYRLDGTLPRAWLAFRALPVASDREGVSRVVAREFDPRRDVAIADAPAGLPSGDAPPDGSAWARVTSSRRMELRVRTASPVASVLVMSDAWSPGWRATVDGRPARVLRANVDQRAVSLPPGAHAVRLWYAPRAVTVGLWVSAAGVAGLALLAALLRRRAGEAVTPPR